MSKSPIVIETIRSRRGEVLSGHHAEILPGAWIRLYGTYEKVTYAEEDGHYVRHTEHVPYSTTFKMGDVAEYDSYNYSYTGTLVSITEKTVTIVDGPERKRLWLDEFVRRNYDFDIEAIRQKNALVSEGI